MTTLALIDDHQMFREALRAMLEQDTEFRVVAEAGDAHEACTKVEETNPDVVLLDVTLPGASGVSVARELVRRTPTRRILFCSMHLAEQQVGEGLAAGALGYVGKEQPAAELVRALRCVANGQSYVAPSVSRHVVEGYARSRRGEAAPVSTLDRLSAREREVLGLVLRGFTNDAIGRELFISKRTVETHRANILRKLDVRTGADLFRLAAREGLLQQ